jgi:hypothetical protein
MVSAGARGAGRAGAKSAGELTTGTVGMHGQQQSWRVYGVSS